MSVNQNDKKIILKQNDLSEKIRNYITDMPSLPVSANKVLEICGNINVNPSDLNKVISLDPVLTGKILQLINSAYYGLGTHVKSLVRAITMLGLNTVKNLVLSTAVLNILQKNREKKGINIKGFWHHCLCVGVISKLLAVKQGVDPKYHEEYFTAGLLHDIGKIPMNAVLSSDYTRLVAASDLENKTLYEIESENLELNHCTAGNMIASAWKLDSSIIDVITFHHNACAYRGENTAIVCNAAIANYFSVVNEAGFAGDRKPVKPEKIIWDTAGINEDAYPEVLEKLNNEIDRARIFLHIT
ncbi:MAG: HDOD domain-containing protein [Treponema sp.]|jgi:putative nucleotidyltransferase with HDIG domain|nr:HDOD domain-containing protein [Treponema sp.]